MQNLSKRDMAGLPRAGKHKAHTRPQQEGGGGERTPRREPRPSTHAPPAPGQLPRTQVANLCRHWCYLDQRAHQWEEAAGGGDCPLPPMPTQSRIRHKTAATRTKWRIIIVCELHWLLRVLEGQARQVTLPGREIDTGRGAFVPFVTWRTPSARHTRSLSTYIPPPLPISNRTQKAPQRWARANTKTAAPPKVTNTAFS